MLTRNNRKVKFTKKEADSELVANLKNLAGIGKSCALPEEVWDNFTGCSEGLYVTLGDGYTVPLVISADDEAAVSYYEEYMDWIDRAVLRACLDDGGLAQMEKDGVYVDGHFMTVSRDTFESMVDDFLVNHGGDPDYEDCKVLWDTLTADEDGTWSVGIDLPNAAPGYYEDRAVDYTLRNCLPPYEGEIQLIS